MKKLMKFLLTLYIILFPSLSWSSEPSGPKGSNISKEEKQKIFKAVSEVDEKIAKLKLSIK